MDLRGLSGRADIETDSGDIRTHRLEPVTVRAMTDAGNVSLDLFGQPARTEAKSDAGDVRVTVPYGPYRVDASDRRGQRQGRGRRSATTSRRRPSTRCTDAGDISGTGSR